MIPFGSPPQEMDHDDLSTNVNQDLSRLYERIIESWPESFKWTVQLYSWILQVVVTQVQLSQTGGLGAENGRQSFTAPLWEVTATQSGEMKIKKNSNVILVEM